MKSCQYSNFQKKKEKEKEIARLVIKLEEDSL